MKFETTLEKHDKYEATGITIPFDVEEVFGAKRVPVIISINGAEYRTTVFRMKGEYMVPVPKAFREAAGVSAGERITVEIEKDAEPRTVEVPADLAEALAAADLKEVFDRLSYTHRKEYVRAVEGAKRPETRARRVENTLRMLADKKTLN
jgi:bifunctional DNA-binding transcriptional regulator/antitoxin component of YhaV-PrlF toxin-antitoxin module